MSSFVSMLKINDIWWIRKLVKQDVFSDNEIEKEMTKLGLQNEKKKEHSKILEYLEHQKELCRENPKRKSCSKTKVSFKKFEYSNDAIVGKYYF